MRKQRSFYLFVALAAAIVGVWLATERYGFGRRLWHPAYRIVTGKRTHQRVLGEIGPRHRAGLQEAVASLGLSYPPASLTLIGLKEEEVLEVWAPAEAEWKLVREYPILAASGRAGPKLREGDRQVPEGVYRLTEFNPNSSYHLSIRVNYPNTDDHAIAQSEGRTNLGGDIFIHGKAVSIGCLAIGDASIEELYVLLADVGLAHCRLLLAPSAFPTPMSGSPDWVADLYQRLRDELARIRGTVTNKAA